MTLPRFEPMLAVPWASPFSDPDWTAAGRLRHPRFRGFTDDLSDAITWEAEGPGSG